MSALKRTCVTAATALALLGAASLATASVAKTVRGTAAGDVLVGTPTADRIYAYAGHDAVYGGGGDDRLDGGWGRDHIWGGDGADLIVGGPRGELTPDTHFTRHERIFGGSGDDVIRMHIGGSLVFGGPGDDRIDVRDPQTDCAIPLPARTFSAASGPTRKLDPPHCINLVLTGPGQNFVRADDGNYDAISCQGTRDRVIADQYDRFSPRDCDATVVRR
ncbi:MAG: hypothetical protein M3321_08980 [Actinomycetota bacterium]|nr:hypothetical protein [Actinomycetota bacterium]